MIETLRGRSTATAGPRTRPGAPAGHVARPRASWPSRSRPASSSASARAARTGSTRCVAIAASHAAPRSRAGGDRAELPAQDRHGDAQRAGVPARRVLCGRSPSPGSMLPPDVHLQAPPNLTDDFGSLLAAGIDDWGGVSPVTVDHVNPERPWPALDRLRAVTERAGFVLAPRLTIYPEFALDPSRWLDPAMRFPVLDRADAELLGRDDPGRTSRRRSPALATPATAPRSSSSGTRPRRGTRAPRRRRRRWSRRRRALRGPVGEVLAGVLARPGARHRRDRHPVRRPRTRGRRRRRGRR